MNRFGEEVVASSVWARDGFGHGEDRGVEKRAPIVYAPMSWVRGSSSMIVQMCKMASSEHEHGGTDRRVEGACRIAFAWGGQDRDGVKMRYRVGSDRTVAVMAKENDTAQCPSQGCECLCLCQRMDDGAEVKDANGGEDACGEIHKKKGYPQIIGLLSEGSAPL